jgi:hypothetical protein
MNGRTRSGCPDGASLIRLLGFGARVLSFFLCCCGDFCVSVWDFVGRGPAFVAATATATATMVTPLVKRDVVKKRIKKFKRMQHDRKICVKVCFRCFFSPRPPPFSSPPFLPCLPYYPVLVSTEKMLCKRVFITCRRRRMRRCPPCFFLQRDLVHHPVIFLSSLPFGFT